MTGIRHTAYGPNHVLAGKKERHPDLVRAGRGKRIDRQGVMVLYAVCREPAPGETERN